MLFTHFLKKAILKSQPKQFLYDYLPIIIVKIIVDFADIGKRKFSIPFKEFNILANFINFLLILRLN
jgi:hypothetical protein